jgi:hypothetical protein
VDLKIKTTKMKRFFAFLTFLTILSVVSFGQSAAKMVFESNELDYGVILQGSEPLRVFKFKNTGTEPLIITSAHGSCGCTIPSYSKEPIPPGQSGKIEVRYDTQRIGVFQKIITVTTNETENSHTLLVKGTVNAKPSQEGVPSAKRGFGG